MSASRRLISLRDIMYRYKIGDLVLMLSALDIVRRDSRHADLVEIEASAKTEEPAQQWRDNLAHCLDGAAKMCSGIELDSSLLAQIENLRDTLRAGTQDCRPAVIHTLLDSIIEGIHHNLDHRMFMYVPAKDSS